MAGAFDDLIPAQSVPQGFDDLIPQQGDASQWGPSMEAANAAMFGMGPKINQWMGEHLPASLAGPPVNANQQQAAAQAWEQQNPKASMAANLVGGSIPYAAVGAATGGAGFIPELATQAAAGAAGNSLLPLSQGQDPTSAALMGGASGAGGKLAGALVGRMLGGTASGIAGAFKPSVNVPTAAGSQAAKTAAYKAANDAGVMYSPGMGQDLANALRTRMAEFGYDPALQPGGAGIVSRMNDFPKPQTAPAPPGPILTTAGPIPRPQPLSVPGSLSPTTPTGSPPLAGTTLEGMDTFRKVINRMGGKGSTDSGQELASQLRGIVDDRLNNPQPGDVLGGDQPGGMAALNEGRRLAQIGFKSDDFSTAMEKAEDQAATAGSGGNVRNKLAQAAVKLKYGGQNWTPDEMSALQGAITPKGSEQALRVIGKGDPTAHGLAGIAELPTVLLSGLHDPRSLAVTIPAIGSAMAARRLSDAMVKRATDRVGQTILNNGVNPYAPSAAQTAIGSATPYLQRALGSLSAATPRAIYNGQ